MWIHYFWHFCALSCREINIEGALSLSQPIVWVVFCECFEEVRCGVERFCLVVLFSFGDGLVFGNENE